MSCSKRTETILLEARYQCISLTGGCEQDLDISELSLRFNVGIHSI